jgi:AcrR family transcriptional regulator
MSSERSIRQLPMVDVRAERCDAAANRARILEVAGKLLREEGLAGVSIDRIAMEAGVGKGTVFRRFGDRAGLTAALLDEHMRAFQNSFLSGPPPLGPGAPAPARLEAFVDGLLALLDEDLEIAVAAEHAAPGAGGVVAGALALHVRTLISQIDPNLDAALLADLLLGTLSPPVIARARAHGGLVAQQAAARALLRGLTPDVS